MKDVVVIGGPNGAGKTTAASQLLPTELELNEFLNADEIARGLSPFDPDSKAVAAGRIMIERIADIIAAGKSFAFETTGSVCEWAITGTRTDRRASAALGRMVSVASTRH